MDTALFRDRREAGRRLADTLRTVAAIKDPVVLGLPRGGIPVAFEVAKAFDAPLDVCVVRKLGVPGHEEFAMGAIASGDVQLLDAVVRKTGLSKTELFRRGLRQLAGSVLPERRPGSAYAAGAAAAVRGARGRLQLVGRA